MANISKEQLIQMAKIEKARRSFWYYCKLMYPSFYKDNREYLKKLCDALQDFSFNDNEYMIINAPPRHGKSFTATNFIEWILGKNPTLKIMSGSYNEDLSKTFSKKIRTTIETEKINNKLVYNDIFPETKIKYGNAEAKKWQIEASSQINYLATSPTGTATGFGADLQVIDDLIKSDLEANNESVLQKQFDWFTNTMLSRREGKKKVLIIMTRWKTKDLAGRMLKWLDDNNEKYTHINFKAKGENNKMLCEEIFSLKDFENAKNLMGEDTLLANYQQEAIDLKNALYSDLKTYEVLPTEIKAIENYTDTADTGEDYLCSIDYAISADNKAYILDVLYTQQPMEITEPLTAAMITKDKVNYARIESNNGGRGFARNVKKEAREKYNNIITIFKPFHQSQNKISRILTGATGVMNNIYFPTDWKNKFPDFYKDVTAYQRVGKNAHDDSVDALTGVFETLDKRYIRVGGNGGLRL